MHRRLLVWILLLTLFSGTAFGSEPFSVDAKGAVLIDGKSGRILFAQNADEPLPMASTTKIMTAILALENTDLDETVTAGKNAHGVEGTSIYLSEGESLSMEHMLYGLMLRSGNDASVAIAEHVAGSVDAFADMMNEKARTLGADAHFVNPHGLPAEKHRASALGMAKIMRYAMQNEEFRTITATRRKVIPWVGNEYSRVLENKNRLLTTYEGATGGKTGYTRSAGRCLVFSAERDGMELIGAVLNCPTWFDTATALLDYGFEHFRSETSLVSGQTAGKIPVDGGNAKTVYVVAETDLSSVIPVGQQYTVRYEYIRNPSAPIRKGQVLGTARMICGGSVIAECDLLAAESVDRHSFSASMERILKRWPFTARPAHAK